MKLIDMEVPELAAESLPARGVWIEIEYAVENDLAYIVTPREGGVD